MVLVRINLAGKLASSFIHHLSLYLKLVGIVMEMNVI